jgi:hypothetical protein
MSAAWCEKSTLSVAFGEWLLPVCCQNPMCILYSQTIYIPSTHLKNVCSPFVPFVRFLALTFDRKLPGELHLRQLRCKCGKTRSILWALSGSTWGGDRNELVRAYRAEILSKFVYINFVYSSASKSKISILDPIHSVGIRLPTGAFHVSRLASFHAESREPPLRFWKYLLPCR